MIEEEKKKKLEALFDEALSELNRLKGQISNDNQNRASADDKKKIDQILGKIKNEL